MERCKEPSQGLDLGKSYLSPLYEKDMKKKNKKKKKEITHTLTEAHKYKSKEIKIRMTNL